MLTPEQAAGAGVPEALRETERQRRAIEGHGPGLAGLFQRFDEIGAPTEGGVTILDPIQEIARLAKRVWWQSRKIRHLLIGADVTDGAAGESEETSSLQAQVNVVGAVLRAVDQEQQAILKALGETGQTTPADVEEALEDPDPTLREKSEEAPPAGGKPVMRGGPELE